MADYSSSDAAPSTETGSVESAAARIEAMLSGDEPEKRRKPQSKAAEAPPVDEAPEQEATAPEENEAETSEASPDQGEEDEASTEATEEDQDDSSEGDQTYTVKVDGKEVSVTLDELKAGYSRTADYTRKTEALAQERRSFIAEVENVQAERAQYAQLLPALTAQLQAALPQAPDPSLRESDPLTYVLEKERYEDGLQRIQAAVSEMHRVQEAQQQEQTKLLAQHLAQAAQRLPELIPAWKDKAAYERDRPKLREYLKTVGYSDEEINQAYDPRAVANAWKAMRYDEIMSKRPRPDAPIERAIRPTPTAASKSSPKPMREAQVARKRLAETGRVEDAALAIRSLL